MSAKNKIKCYALKRTDRVDELHDSEGRVIRSSPLWIDTRNENMVSLHEAEPGAVCDADWLHDIPEMCGPDGKSLIVKLPNGHFWYIDSRASNCTRKDDKVHKCWCRHGSVEDGTLHVDKNGDTCAAGAGSILSGNYHGFLHNGYLVEC